MRDLLSDIAYWLARNKALADQEGWYAVAVDGYAFFSSRKRRGPQCQTRCRTVDGEPVTEYYHQGVDCHRIGQDVALVLDVEMMDQCLPRPPVGESVGTAGGQSRMVNPSWVK